MIDNANLKTLYITTRMDWCAWLKKHFDPEPEVWLVFSKRASSTASISYNNAGEEASCFGWIDSKVKNLDEESSIQHFSPRNPKSGFSQANKERLRRLLKEQLLHPTVRNTIRKFLEEVFPFLPIFKIQ